MTSVAPTVLNTKNHTAGVEVQGRIDSIPDIGGGFMYVPLIDETWTKPSVVESYDNGGDGLSIGTPATPGFYKQTDGYQSYIADRDLLCTWKTIDIRNFSEYYVYVERPFHGSGKRMVLHPIFAIEDDHDEFKLILSHYLNEADSVGWYQCYQSSGSEHGSYKPYGLLGVAPWHPSQFKNYAMLNYHKEKEAPELYPFQCMGRFMKLAFGDFTQTNPVAATFDLTEIDKLGVFVR